MKENKEVKISYWAAHLTTIVSVTLVLLIVGVIAMAGIGAASETRRLKEKLELSVIMADSVPDSRAKDLSGMIAAKPYAHSVKVITKVQALENWKKETGEDLEKTFGVNPLSPEVTFGVRADYASTQSIARISKELSALPGVESVGTPDASMVERMNENIEKLALGLGCIALVMIIISFVLINNTVHLSIYSRRFSIHTMQLVGATNGFIKRPFIANNMLSGLLAGVLAATLLALGLFLSPEAGFPELRSLIGITLYAAVAAGLILTGALLCGLAAWIATARYLHKNYDELFK